MASGYTIFTTYVFIPTGNSLSQAIHCNYIKSLQLSAVNIGIQEISMSFPNIDDFKFLSTDITTGTGFTANRIYAVIQLVNNSGFTSGSTVTPDVTQWKIVDLTSQVSGYTGILTPAQLVGVVFKISLFNYNTYPAYNLSYLNYPSYLPSAASELCFGDEIYFLGNVVTDIQANVFTTNLSIPLALNQFNSSTNPTWDGLSVFATEVGIYDGGGNLVAIGKFNDPVEKNENLNRTIQFAIDF